MALGDIKQISIHSGSLGTTTGDTRYILPSWDTGEWELIAAGVIPDATLAANATDYASVAFGDGTTTFGTLTSATVAFTAGTERFATLTGTKASTLTGQADPLIVTITKAGSGGTFEAEIVAVFRRRPEVS